MNRYDIKNKIKDLFIVQEDDGSYNLFGSYLVNQLDNGIYKIAIINSDYHRDTIEMSTLKYAVTWCVFEKNNKYKERERVHELDQLISSLNVNITQHKKLAQKTSTPDKFIYLAKLNEEKMKKKQALEEIEHYAAISRYLQGKKYLESKD